MQLTLRPSTPRPSTAGASTAGASTAGASTAGANTAGASTAPRFRRTPQPVNPSITTFNSNLTEYIEQNYDQTLQEMLKNTVEKSFQIGIEHLEKNRPNDWERLITADNFISTLFPEIFTIHSETDRDYKINALKNALSTVALVTASGVAAMATYAPTNPPNFNLTKDAMWATGIAAFGITAKGTVEAVYDTVIKPTNKIKEKFIQFADDNPADAQNV